LNHNWTTSYKKCIYFFVLFYRCRCVNGLLTDCVHTICDRPEPCPQGTRLQSSTTVCCETECVALWNCPIDLSSYPSYGVLTDLIWRAMVMNPLVNCTFSTSKWNHLLIYYIMYVFFWIAFSFSSLKLNKCSCEICCSEKR